MTRRRTELAPPGGKELTTYGGRVITLTGTRSTNHRLADHWAEVFDRWLRPWVTPGTHFLIGGATGIDTHGLLWLAGETDCRLTVVVPAKLDDQPADARLAIETMRFAGRLTELVELGGMTNTAGYYARNRWMVDRSVGVVGFPRVDTPRSGTYYTLNYAASHNLPRLIVPV